MNGRQLVALFELPPPPIAVGNLFLEMKSNLLEKSSILVLYFEKRGGKSFRTGILVKGWTITVRVRKKK